MPGTAQEAGRQRCGGSNRPSGIAAPIAWCPTRFLSGGNLRNAQQAVVAIDIIALMDALAIERAILAGCDWGARTANIIAALWPQRCKAMVSVPQEAPQAFAHGGRRGRRLMGVVKQGVPGR
jgi:pimeloyl-ACP methyl ester carboxylesterase